MLLDAHALKPKPTPAKSRQLTSPLGRALGHSPARGGGFEWECCSSSPSGQKSRLVSTDSRLRGVLQGQAQTARVLTSPQVPGPSPSDAGRGGQRCACLPCLPLLPESGSKGPFSLWERHSLGNVWAFIPFPRLTSLRGEKPSSEAMGYGGHGACDGSLRKEEAWGPQPALLPGEARAGGLSIPVRTRQSPQPVCPHVAQLSSPQLEA